MTRRIRTLIIGALFVVAACGPGETVVSGNGAGDLNYNHDAAHHVSCWVYVSHGVSCLPDAEVTIP